MEIPDVIVVNKADHPMTDTMIREIRGVLSLGPADLLAGADRPHRGREGRGGRRAGREDRRAPRAHRGRGHAGGAARPEPAQRGAGAGRSPDAAAPRGGRRGRPIDRRAAGPRRQAASSIPPAPPPSCWSARMAEPKIKIGREGASQSTPEPRRGGRLGRQADRRHRRARPWAASPASTSTPRTASRAGSLIRLGPLAGCTAIPFEHVAEGAGRLWAAYERDWVREAPRFKPDEALTADRSSSSAPTGASARGRAARPRSPSRTATRSPRSRRETRTAAPSGRGHR